MFSRCIEIIKEKKTNKESLKLLLNFYRTQNISQLEILLLPGKYQIDLDVYQKCKENGIIDPFFEWSLDRSCHQLEYHHNLHAFKSNLYLGYRNAYPYF